jgi:hypothetical protein
MLAAYFCQSPLIKGRIFLTRMNVRLLAASALQSCALLVIYPLFCNCPMLSQPKTAVHQHAAKLFQQHWRHLKRNYDLNSAFEKADR